MSMSKASVEKQSRGGGSTTLERVEQMCVTDIISLTASCLIFDVFSIIRDIHVSTYLHKMENFTFLHNFSCNFQLNYLHFRLIFDWKSLPRPCKKCMPTNFWSKFLKSKTKMPNRNLSSKHLLGFLKNSSTRFQKSTHHIWQLISLNNLCQKPHKFLHTFSKKCELFKQST